MRTTALSVLTLAARLGALASLPSCGSSTFASGEDAGTSADAVADLGSDGVIVVSHGDGATGNDAISGADAGPLDATLGVHDGSSDAATSGDAVQPADAEADSVVDAGGDSNGGATGNVDASTEVTVSGRALADGQSGAFVTISLPLSWTTTPLAFRHIGLRDATGKLATTSTDANGAFQFTGVTPPYDAVVYPGDPSGWPYVYLGLSTAHPRLAGPVVVQQRSVTINVSVQFQDCGSSTCQCAATYWFPALQELESVGCGPVTPSNLTETFNPAMAWTGPATATADLHVLEWDPQNQHFWHAVASGITMTANQAISVPQLVLAPVPTLGNLSLTVTTNGVPQAWTEQASIGYQYANNDGQIVLINGTAPTLTSGVPNLAGASMSASASFMYPGTLLQEGLTFARTLPLPLSTASATVTVNAAPSLSSPVSAGTLSQSGTIAWSDASSNHVYSVALTPYVAADAGPNFGTTEAWVFTSGSSVDLGRVTTMNVALSQQSTWLQLGAAGQVASLDAMLDEQTLATPDGTQGSWVSVPFTLTP
jgi:hypothetical protein